MSRMDEALRRFRYDPDEDVGPYLAQAPEVELGFELRADDVTEEFLAFRLGAETYAIPIGALREIVKVPSLTAVPRAAPHLLGVMNVRGEMVPVYDIKPKLKLAPAAQRVRGPRDTPREARVILLKDVRGDAGVLVDGVEGVVRLPLGRLEAPPLPGMDRDGVAGVGRKGDALYILLDVEQALDE